MSLRDELLGVEKPAPTAPTPYRLLCPAGWRRVPTSVLADEMAEAAVARFKEAGRPDLVLQMRGMISQLRSALRASRAFDAYLPPLIRGNPLPAVLTVAPFVRPAEVSWDAAIRRLARNAPVDMPEFTETTMWRWTRDEQMDGEPGEPALRTRVRHYVVPVEGEADTRRALHFVFTVMNLDGVSLPDEPAAPDAAAVTEVLLETGDVILSTMRWVAPKP
ncbi:hypothetical protein ACI3KY_02780 [Microbacterium sp. ZW T2_14]|uniref:hypothetical protein n=1 Tax=Microbacterium sp. ZW T2_14 TaxID=3378079 RepID=UPI0038551BCD